MTKLGDQQHLFHSLTEWVTTTFPSLGRNCWIDLSFCISFFSSSHPFSQFFLYIPKIPLSSHIQSTTLLLEPFPVSHCPVCLSLFSHFCSPSASLYHHRLPCVSAEYPFFLFWFSHISPKQVSIMYHNFSIVRSKD